MRCDAGERSVPVEVGQQLTKLLTDRQAAIAKLLPRLPVSP